MAETLNLRKNAVDAYWRRTNIKLAEVLASIDEEEIEHWCVDDEEDVKVSLTELAVLLEDESANIMAEDILDRADRVIFILAYMRFGRAVRLLVWLNETYDKERLSYALVQISLKEKNKPYYRLLLDRLLFLKNFGQLNAIYGDKNSALLEKVLVEFNRQKEG